MNMRKSYCTKLAAACIVWLFCAAVARCAENTKVEIDPHKDRLVAAVDALKNAETASQQDDAKRMLLRYLLHPDLPSFSDVMLPFLEDAPKSEISCLLLGRLRYPESIREVLLASDLTPKVVRARMGDQSAEAAIIRQFREASRIVDVRKRCEEILYIDSKQTREAFVDALQSREIVESSSHGGVARSYIVLQAYTMVVPSVGLLSGQSVTKHGVKNPRDFGEEAHQTYLKQISAYFSETLGQKVVISTPFFYIESEPTEHYVPVMKSDGTKSTQGQ